MVGVDAAASTETGAAYGLRLAGSFSPALAGLVAVSAEHAGWPLARLSWGEHVGPRPPEVRSAHCALVYTLGGFVSSRREPLAIDVRACYSPTAATVVHPYLASAARVVAHWTGRSSYYGGSFVLGEAAWALLGKRGTGKTTLLCELARLGFPVLSDDVTVLDGMRALVGPRLLAVRDLTLARGLAQLPERSSVAGLHLVRAGSCPTEAPFGGWVLLERGPRVSLKRLDALELVRRVAPWVSVCPDTPGLLLEWLALPAWVLELPEPGSVPGRDNVELAAVAVVEALLSFGLRQSQR